MKDIYFNTWRYYEAKKMIKIDPIEAKRLFEEYIVEYPKDYNAQTYYVYILIILNMPNEAKQILDNLEIMSSLDPIFNRESSKVSKLKKDIIKNRMRLLAYYENYEELHNYYERYRYILNDDRLAPVNFMSRKKLNLLKKQEYEKENQGYLFGQILEYDEQALFTHIQKHLTDSNEEEINNNIFAENFPINEIIEEVKKYIPSDKRLCFSMVADSYYFKYNDCGRDSNKITNFFKVVCLHNTSNIITICPVKQNENIPHIDLNYLNKDKGPVKTLSQIEKFNRKFRRQKTRC